MSATPRRTSLCTHTISVLDANDAPTDLLKHSIVENNDPFTPIDPDGIIDGSEMDVIKSFMTLVALFDVITSVESNARRHLPLEIHRHD